MATELLTESINDINVSFETAECNTADVIQDFRAKLEKQSHAFLKLKQKIIATDSVLKSYKQAKEQLEAKEIQLQSERQEYENISADYKSLLEKFIPLEKLYDEQKETLCSLQAELQNVTGQKLAIEMHAKQLQVLVNNLESKIEVTKVEYQLLKSSHEEEKKNLTKETKSPRQRVNNKIHCDLLIFGNAARKAGILTKRQISLLEKYRKSDETNCPDVEEDVLDIDDIQMSPTYSSNNGILSCRSVDTGRGSSLMSSDDEKISDNVLCDLIDDSQINTPLCSPKTLDTILDAGLLEAKLKSFCTTATSPIKRIHVDASTSPIKKSKKHNVECSSTPSIMHKLLAKHEMRSEVSDTRVNNMLKEMITDYTLVSPIPWKKSKDVNRRLLPRTLRNKVEQHRNKLRYMLERKKSRLRMHKAINNIDRKVNKLLESKNEVRPPNISCLCNSKADLPKPTETVASEEIINLVSRVALQTSNHMNNSIVSTILNTLLPLNSIYSSFKATEADKSQEVLKKCMDYITARERIESPSGTCVDTSQKTNSYVSSEIKLPENETQNNCSLDSIPINDTTNDIPAHTVRRNKDNWNKSKQMNRLSVLNKNEEVPETLPIQTENRGINARQPVESNSDTRQSNDHQIDHPSRLRDSSTNCHIVIRQNLPEPKDIKRKRNSIEKNETIVSNATLTSNKNCCRAAKSETPVESVYSDLFGDSNSDHHNEMSDEDDSVPLQNLIVKRNSTIKKVTKKSKVTKLQSLRKSLRSCNRKIQREPSLPPAKKKKPTVNTVELAGPNVETSDGIKISKGTMDVQQSFEKAVKVMNEIKNKKLLTSSPAQRCKLRKSRSQKKSEVEEQLTNENKFDKIVGVNEVDCNSNDAPLEIQNRVTKLNICSSINNSHEGDLSADAPPKTIIGQKNSISEKLTEEEPILTEKNQNPQVDNDSSERLIHYDDLDMFIETTNNESSVQSPMKVSNKHEDSHISASPGKPFFIGMIEKYSSFRKRKINNFDTGKAPTDITYAIQTCISYILDSTLCKPIPEMNKLCDNMVHVKPADFARAVVETLMDKKQRNDCLCRTYTPPAPPMYKSEQILLYVINKIQKMNNNTTILTDILDSIEYKLFRLGSTPEMDQVESLSRFFAVLCRHTKQMRKLRTFVLDAMYCLNFKVLLVFQEVINVWSHIIPKATTNTANDPLVLAIVHLLHFINYNNEDKTEAIRRLLATRYGYNPGSCNQQELLKKFDSLVKGIGVNDIYNHKSISLAFILIGKRYGPQWCHKHLVNGIITPIMNDTILEQHVRAFAASLLGPLLRPYPATMNLHCEMTINKLTLLIGNGESPEIEEAAISSVLMLKKFAYDRVVKILQNWAPERLISEELENQIKEFVREKQTGVWIKILKKA